MSNRKTVKSSTSVGKPKVKGFFSEHIILFLLLSLGLFLRVWNIGWGLPEIYEEATPLVKAWKMWNWGVAGMEFNPHFFNYPALTFYLHLALQGINYLVGHLLGIYASIDTFAASLSTIVIPARLMTSLFDIGTVITVYLLALEAANRRVALVAAALVAINPLLVAQAHYITVDTPLTFFVTLSLLFIFRVAREGDRRSYLLAGLCIGLATATKYTGAFLLVVLVAVHLQRSESFTKALRSLMSIPLLSSIALAASVFFLTNPYIIVSFDEFLRDFSFEQYHVGYGHLGIDTSQSTLSYYLFDVLPAGLGWGLYSIFLATALTFIRQKEKRYYVLFFFPLLYLAIVSSWQMRAERYVLPIIPIIIVIAAIGVTTYWNVFRGMLLRLDFFRNRNAQLSGSVVALALGTLILFKPLAADYEFHQSIIVPDTRVVAKEWIKTHLPSGSTIATGPYGIQFSESTYRVLDIPFIAVEAERAAPFYDSRWYEDCDLLIASDYDYGRFAMDPKKYGDFLPYYDSLRSSWKLALEVKPQPHQQGPTIWLYQPTEALIHLRFDASLFEKLHGVDESLRVSNFLRDLENVVSRKGRQEKSEQILREILSVEPSNMNARVKLARILDTTGRYDQALLQLQMALRLEPIHADLFSYAGEILAKTGHDREAEMSWLKAMQLNPYYEPLYPNLIGMYTKRNDKKNLIATYQRYRGILHPNSEKLRDVEEALRQIETNSR